MNLSRSGDADDLRRRITAQGKIARWAEMCILHPATSRAVEGLLQACVTYGPDLDDSYRGMSAGQLAVDALKFASEYGRPIYVGDGRVEIDPEDPIIAAAVERLPNILDHVYALDPSAKASDDVELLTSC